MTFLYSTSFNVKVQIKTERVFFEPIKLNLWKRNSVQRKVIPTVQLFMKKSYLCRVITLNKNLNGRTIRQRTHKGNFQNDFFFTNKIKSANQSR